MSYMGLHLAIVNPYQWLIWFMLNEQSQRLSMNQTKILNKIQGVLLLRNENALGCSSYLKPRKYLKSTKSFMWNWELNCCFRYSSLITTSYDNIIHIYPSCCEFATILLYKQRIISLWLDKTKTYQCSRQFGKPLYRCLFKTTKRV